MSATSDQTEVKEELDPTFLVVDESVFEPDSQPQSQTDQLARKEAQAIAEGEDLDRDGKKKEHHRHQAFRDHVNRAALVVFWVIVACLVLGILIFSFHLLTPEKWHFLTPEQLSDVKTILTSALLSSALTGYVKARMSG